MRPLDERHTSRADEVLNQVWMILAHEELTRLDPRSVRKPDQWLARRADQLRVDHDARARRIIDAQPQMLEADLHVAARAVADRLRKDPTPSPSPEPVGDKEAGLGHVRRLKAQLKDGNGG